MKWTNDAIFEFLIFYRNEPALWDTRSASHKNRNDQYDAWTRIQNELKKDIIDSVSIKEIKKKRDNLMSTYRKLRSKIEKSVKTGRSINNVYTPDWPFYGIMSSFLDDVYNPRTTKNSDEPEDEEIKQDGENDTAEKKEKKPNIEGSELSFETLNHHPKHLKMNKTEEKMNGVYNYLPITQETEQDECYLYSQLLCKKLRGLQEKTRDIAMLEIDKLIFELKQREMKIEFSS
ncbi:hypothetical protein ABEB36_008698 [Hypothenemus hampei]|uniref:MADF domain-containing protein n=1 Tax=Hypothenemus hampei TaxID=57062 RepID=A0ABD1EMS4_HYPHA